MSAPVTRTDRRRERVRRELTAAGRAAIAAGGIGGLTVQQVTEAADVGRGTFYNHFAAKDELVAEIAREAIAEPADRAVVDPSAHPDPAVRACLADRRFLELSSEDPATARLIVNLARDSALFEQAVRPYAREILAAGVRSGRFVLADLDMTLLILQSSALAVMRGLLDGTVPTGAPSRHAEGMLVLFGLAPAEAAEIVAQSL